MICTFSETPESVDACTEMVLALGKCRATDAFGGVIFAVINASSSSMESVTVDVSEYTPLPLSNSTVHEGPSVPGTIALRANTSDDS